MAFGIVIKIYKCMYTKGKLLDKGNWNNHRRISVILLTHA